MPRSVVSSFAYALALGTLLGCEPDPSESDPSTAEEFEFLTHACQGAGGFANTIKAPLEHIPGISGRDLVNPTPYQALSSADSFTLMGIQVEINDVLTDLRTVWADEYGLHGRTNLGVVVDGEDFLAARFSYVREDAYGAGENVEMRIDQWDDSTGIPSYRFVLADNPNPDSEDAQVCTIGPNGSFMATVYQDLDYDVDSGEMPVSQFPSLMISCHSSVVAKADLWGWGIHSGFDRQTHEAASRVVRGDYCADGNEGWSEIGTMIYIADNLGVHEFPAEADEADVEAIWGIDGVLCIKQPRLPVYEADDVVCGGLPVPVCQPGDNLSTVPGAVFMTKV